MKKTNILIFIAVAIVGGILSYEATDLIKTGSYGGGASMAQAEAVETFGPGAGPSLAPEDVDAVLSGIDQIIKVEDIAKDPRDIPPPIVRNTPAVVEVELEAKEVIAEMADGISFNYWTFNGTVPGPMIRAREGDTVKLTLKNNESSIHPHNIDLHAVTGPGGGAKVTNVEPGESKTVTFKALHPGLYVYHCAHPNAATHMAHGMYGLILVEPQDSLPKVDQEFYMMQGEFYGEGALGEKGLQIFDANDMLNSQPDYIVFNGRVGALDGKINAETGETVRLFVGNGGVNLVSSFHVIGEVFDRVYNEGSLSSEPLKNVQTTIVPAGGANMVEFDLQVPGDYVLVDHALARLDRGAWGVLKVSGASTDESIYQGDDSNHDHNSHSN